MSTYKSVFRGDNYLMHFNPWPRQKGGRFGFAPIGSRHRYVTTDTATYKYDPETGKEIPKDRQYTYTSERLTNAGKRRYEYEQSTNNARSRKNRLDEEAVADPDRWARDDISGAKNIVEGVGSITKSGGELIGPMFKDPPRGRYDLSNMTDQELRAVLNREQMERQYNDYFNPQQENKGRQAVETAVKVIGTSAAIASTALGIALTIKQLKGKSS